MTSGSPRLNDLRVPTEETGYIDPMDWRPVSIADLVEVLIGEGAEKVKVKEASLVAHALGGPGLYLVFRLEENE